MDRSRKNDALLIAMSSNRKPSGLRFDPRSVATRAESYLKFTDWPTANVGPKRVFVFDSVSSQRTEFRRHMVIPTKETETRALGQRVRRPN